MLRWQSTKRRLTMRGQSLTRGVKQRLLSLPHSERSTLPRNKNLRQSRKNLPRYSISKNKFFVVKAMQRESAWSLRPMALSSRNSLRIPWLWANLPRNSASRNGFPKFRWVVAGLPVKIAATRPQTSSVCLPQRPCAISASTCRFRKAPRRRGDKDNLFYDGSVCTLCDGVFCFVERFS